VRPFNLNAVGTDDDSVPLPGFKLGDLPAIANYKKTLAVRFRSVVRFPPKSPLGWRAYISRLKISHRLFAARSSTLSQSARSVRR
jgi:hypothetical protein